MANKAVYCKHQMFDTIIPHSHSSLVIEDIYPPPEVSVTIPAPTPSYTSTGYSRLKSASSHRSSNLWQIVAHILSGILYSVVSTTTNHNYSQILGRLAGSLICIFVDFFQIHMIFILACLLLVFDLRSSSIKCPLSSKIIYHLRLFLFSIKGNLSSKVIFHQSLS